MPITLPYTIANGQAIDATPVMADFNTLANALPASGNAASSGANSDITSLTGLTTPLSVAQGGLGGPDAQGGVLINPYRRNLIDNAAMNVAQRYGTSVQSTAGIWILDRWAVANGASNRCSFQQAASAIPGFPNKLRMTVTGAGAPAAGDAYGFSQGLENLTTAPLNFGTAAAAPLTLSFWVQASITGTFPISLRNAASNRSYISTFTIAVANVPQRVVIQVPGDTAGTWPGWGASVLGLSIAFVPSAGSTYQTSTLNAWQAGNLLAWTGQTQLTLSPGATFDITGVQLEVGNSATAFEQLAFDDELRRAQRFLPGFPISNNPEDIGTVLFGSTSTGTAMIPFPVKTRANVTGIAFTGGGSAASYQATTAGASATLNGMTSTSAGSLSVRVSISQAGATWAASSPGWLLGIVPGAGIVFTGAEI